jgi:hypothetical protein
MVLVRHHVNSCTKKKCMFWISTHGLFLTCTESLFFIKHTKIYAMRCVGYVFNYEKKEEKSLTWTGGPLIMVANPHPSWSLARSQLPLAPPPLPHPSSHFPANKTFIFIQTTLTCPLLLGRAQYFLSLV